MNAREKNEHLARCIARRFDWLKVIDVADAATLRRAERTLHRWYELECGDSNSYQSWCVERDENSTGNEPYMVRRIHYTGKVYRDRIADRENGAIRRINALCDRLGLYAYFQTDPRGCALYVSNEPLDQTNYTQGLACCV